MHRNNGNIIMLLLYHCNNGGLNKNRKMVPKGAQHLNGFVLGNLKIYTTR